MPSSRVQAVSTELAPAGLNQIDLTLGLNPIFFDGVVTVSPPPARPVVLVVEDDEDTRDLVAGALERDGMDVFCARDRASAAEILRSWSVDAVTLDIGLPDGDGLGLCEAMRKRPGGRAIPIVAVTARTTFDAELNSFLSGVDDYLVKPVRPADVVRRIRRLINSRS